MRCVGNIIKEEFCIVLYCLDKILILYGESFLLKYIVGWFCDLREDIVMFGGYVCFDYCLFFNFNFLEFGCSIGIFLDKFVGFVGFLVELINLVNNFGLGCGFFIVFYVVVKSFEELYCDEFLLFSYYCFVFKEYFIVYLLC